jgi:hypothetical protein
LKKQTKSFEKYVDGEMRPAEKTSGFLLTAWSLPNQEKDLVFLPRFWKNQSAVTVGCLVPRESLVLPVIDGERRTREERSPVVFLRQ